MLQAVLDVLDGAFVYHLQGSASARLLDDFGEVLGAVAECVGIIRHGAVRAAVLCQHPDELPQDVVRLFQASPCLVFRFGSGNLLADDAHHLAEEGGEEALYHLLMVIMRFIVDFRYNQVAVEAEYLVAFHVCRFDGILVDVGDGVPRALFHLDNPLQEAGGEGGKPYLVLGAEHRVADDGVGKSQHQVARLHVVGLEVDVQLGMPLHTDDDEEALQPYRAVGIRNPFGGGLDDEIIVYIIYVVLVLFEVFNAYIDDVLFSHKCSFFVAAQR